MTTGFAMTVSSLLQGADKGLIVGGTEGGAFKEPKLEGTEKLGRKDGSISTNLIRSLI
jgi:hypothetical protein